MSGNVFHYVDTRPRTCSQPLSFYHLKTGLCYKPALPKPDHGTHVTLHRNLSARYARPDTVGEKLAYASAIKILYKQRKRGKVFSGQAPPSLYSTDKTTKKLSSYDRSRHPPDSSLLKDVLFFPHTVVNKPLYSKDEVKAIVDRLYQRKKDEGRFPPLIHLDHKRDVYTAEIVEDLIEIYGSTNRLCPNPPNRNLFRDRIAAREITNANSRQMHTEEVDTLVYRLNQYDVTKWPPNSTHHKTQEPGSPVGIKYPPPGSASSRQVDTIVDRLYSGRWREKDTENTRERKQEKQPITDNDSEEADASETYEHEVETTERPEVEEDQQNHQDNDNSHAKDE